MTQAFAVYYRPKFKDLAIFVTDDCFYLSSPDGLIRTFERIKQQRGEFHIKFPNVYRGYFSGFEAVDSQLASTVRDAYSAFNNGI